MIILENIIIILGNNLLLSRTWPLSHSSGIRWSLFSNNRQHARYCSFKEDKITFSIHVLRIWPLLYNWSSHQYDPWSLFLYYTGHDRNPPIILKHYHRHSIRLNCVFSIEDTIIIPLVDMIIIHDHFYRDNECLRAWGSVCWPRGQHQGRPALLFRLPWYFYCFDLNRLRQAV